MADDLEPIRAQRDEWERLAQDDPLWAILSDPALRHNQWDTQHFFDTGPGEVATLLSDIAERDLTLRHGRALDFGCGVGRLTQALATTFERVDGVDIAPTMIDLARKFNKHGDRCSYHVNTEPDLLLFDAGTFDFVYSTMVLQHIPPPLATGYIRELIRVLAPGGLAVFEMPSHLTMGAIPEGGHHARLLCPQLPARMEAMETSVLRVDVQNTSPYEWPASMSIRLGNHWLSSRGRQKVQDDGRTPLLSPLPAGSTTSLDLHVQAPGRPGRYQIELDMVEEGVAWFGQLGSETLRSPLRVGKASLDKAEQPVHESSPPFTMNALPSSDVKELIRQSGGDLVACSESARSGPEWQAYRYYVRGPESSSTDSGGA